MDLPCKDPLIIRIIPEYRNPRYTREEVLGTPLPPALLNNALVSAVSMVWLSLTDRDVLLLVCSVLIIDSTDLTSCKCKSK